MTSTNNLLECQNVDGIYKIISLIPNGADLLSTESIVCHIGETFKIERAENGVLTKLLPSNEVLDLMARQLCSLTEQLSPNMEIPDSLIILLRSLRNSVTTYETQSYVVYHTDILENIREICHFVLYTEKTDNQYLKLPFQFLINIISSNEASTRVVYKNFNTIIQECFYRNCHIYELSALLYNISRFTNFPSVLIEKIISLANSETQNEYIHFFMENIVAAKYFWEIYNQELCVEIKIVILEFLRNKLLSNKNFGIHPSNVGILSNQFIESVGIVFQTNKETNNDIKVYQVSLILQILSSHSSNEIYLPILQRNKDLFINAGVLLINIHKLGKVADNCFTPVEKLSEFGKSEMNEHPAFGFKADLVRLIGNMCWKNSELQNLARTADLISVILDCCNMDAKNPFIIQWCILAIRNMCDGNFENQKFVADLHEEGMVSSDRLEEMGVTLHSNGEHQLKIVSLKDLNSSN